jgi:hypothetical protein
MESVVVRDHPRAYVAAPVAPVIGLVTAITWAFDQDRELTWKDLGVLVDDPGMVSRLSSLHRLKGRGVRLGTPAQAASARSFHGLVIAFCPDQAMLALAETLPETRGIAAVAHDNQALLDWVDACAPQHLGGQVLPTASPGVNQVARDLGNLSTPAGDPTRAGVTRSGMNLSPPHGHGHPKPLDACQARPRQAITAREARRRPPRTGSAK